MTMAGIAVATTTAYGPAIGASEWSDVLLTPPAVAHRLGVTTKTLQR